MIFFSLDDIYYKRTKYMNIIFILIIIFIILFYREIKLNVETIIKDLLIAIVSLIALIIKLFKKLKR